MPRINDWRISQIGPAIVLQKKEKVNSRVAFENAWKQRSQSDSVYHELIVDNDIRLLEKTGGDFPLQDVERQL